MTNLQKIEAVTIKSDLQIIDAEFRFYIDKYNNQNLDNYKTLFSMFDSFTNEIINKIQEDTYVKFGSSGMVLTSQILPALGLKTNHKILDK
jgi:hypothetical protein